ncbi:hypothetical protein HQQ94_12455 [Shewanella sp. VB17]|nr:hypothetical protein [Shewanella sp. VB17]
MSFWLLIPSLLPLSVMANGSQSLNRQIQPLAIKSVIVDIAVKGNTMVAVGERGHVFVFNNQEVSQWHQVVSPTVAHLTKVFFITPQIGWAVGHDATIIHTRDGGLTWQLQMSSPEVEKPLLDILFFDELNGVAIGAYGLFYRTNNAGKDWIAEYHETLLVTEDVTYLAELKAEDEALYLSERSILLPHLNRVIAMKDGRVLMVGELGLMSVSKDRGRHWQKLDVIYEGSLFNVIESEESVYVMGLRGHLFQAALNLRHWTKIPLPIDSTIHGVMLQHGGGLRVVGNGGGVLDINASGESELVMLRQGENLVSIAEDPQGHIWIAGTKGLFELK